jgi:hypothetical protein
MSVFSGMNNNMKKILIASLFLILFCSYAYAEYEESEGYDENTEIRIKGVVTENIVRPRGPVVVRVRSGNREYRVVTGPQRYLLQEGFEFKPGDQWKVTGSKLIGRDGSIYIIARKIRNVSSGKTLQLRDTSLIPLWRGGPHRMGPHHMGLPPGEPRRGDPKMMRDRD